MNLNFPRLARQLQFEWDFLRHDETKGTEGAEEEENGEEAAGPEEEGRGRLGLLFPRGMFRNMCRHT